jgi:hypothetical protein
MSRRLPQHPPRSPRPRRPRRRRGRRESSYETQDQRPKTQGDQTTELRSLRHVSSQLNSLNEKSTASGRHMWRPSVSLTTSLQQATHEVLRAQSGAQRRCAIGRLECFPRAGDHQAARVSIGCQASNALLVSLLLRIFEVFVFRQSSTGHQLPAICSPPLVSNPPSMVCRPPSIVPFWV